MELDKFTQKSLEVVQATQNLAIKNSNPEVTDLHLHDSLIADSKGMIPQILVQMGVDATRYRRRVQEEWSRLPTQDGNGDIYPSVVYQRIILKSEDTAKSMGDDYVSI
jgi:ATP-dependent Clp protease ATP-binding subunit ClpB